MSARRQDRSYIYLLERLKNEHPALYADLLAGKFPSTRQALIAAGLKQPPKPLNSLKAVWKKASASEQAEFRKWIGGGGAGKAVAKIAHLPSAPRVSPKAGIRTAKSWKSAAGSLVTPSGNLESWVIKRIQSIMAIRKMKMGQVMTEMGYGKLNAALGRALTTHRPSRIDHDMVTALEIWLRSNKGVK